MPDLAKYLIYAEWVVMVPLVENSISIVPVHHPHLQPSTPQVLINLGLVYKVQQHSGIIFQFVAFIRRRQRAVPEILAAGGRYDLLVRLAYWYLLNFIMKIFKPMQKVEPMNTSMSLSSTINVM
jgi:hypothetical protein